MDCQFRDPIHGFIEVSNLELKIIDSPPFQRLRNIKQLATTYLVYPGAEHTRFGHSLGVMHLVTKAFDSALDNYKRTNGKDLFDSTRSAWYRQILRLIALTHDLGHAPFSHASEALFDGDLEHEDFTKKIIYETEIADHIQTIGKEFRKKHSVGEEYNITPKLLWLIYGEKNPELDSEYIMPDYKFLKSFMDSELDCDKMDYLLRDSYYCGVNYGKYDLNKLLSSLNVFYKPSDKIMHLAVDRGGVHAFEEFVIARYFMFIQVYFHKTRRYLDKLLVDNIANILPNSKYPNNVQDYLKWDDLTVIDKIKASRFNCLDAEQFLTRTVMSCVYETSAHSNRSDGNLLLNIIKNKLQEELEHAILEDTANKMPHKIPTLEEYDASSGKGIPILVQYMEMPSSIGSESILLKSLIEPINIRRLYVQKSEAETAKKIVGELLNRGDVN
ncbi:MAG: HD domain-containing protein [Epulopiscium sp.]|nr:HD domain-containing protein [Candidatus Epulonipiscium sp.]